MNNIKIFLNFQFDLTTCSFFSFTFDIKNTQKNINEVSIHFHLYFLFI